MEHKLIHLDMNLYLQIAHEFRFIAFYNLPNPTAEAPMSAYEYEYKTYYFHRRMIVMNLLRNARYEII